MYLEQEAYIYFVVGVALIMVLEAAVLAVAFAKTRNMNLLWFVGQIIFSVFAACFFWECLRNVPTASSNSMYTELQSIPFAKMGICWAVSMVLEVIGILKVAKGLFIG